MYNCRCMTTEKASHFTAQTKERQVSDEYQQGITYQKYDGKSSDAPHKAQSHAGRPCGKDWHKQKHGCFDRKQKARDDVEYVSLAHSPLYEKRGNQQTAQRA